MVRQLFGSVVGALLFATAACAQAPAADMPPRGDTTVADYAKDKAWLCRPGVDDGTCSTNLDAMVIDGKGPRSPQAYVAAKDPMVDCFYIYPTVSNDPLLYSDMNAGDEERRTTHGQAARLGSACRLYVPIYHQLTMTALRYGLTHSAAANFDFDPAYAGVVAAWKSYLAHDNHGRGVVLIGHSQGSILLKRLIADEIDGKPAQKLLVGAYLAGNVDLTTKSFKAVKPCAAVGQTGCIVAWQSYLDTDPAKSRFFGSSAAGAAALCVNPAAPGGGRGMLKPYLSKPGMAPASDPPYVEAIGQMSAECVSDSTGTVLRIRIEPGPYADLLGLALGRASAVPGWGLHPLDVNLVQGNVIDMIQAQSTAWEARR